MDRARRLAARVAGAALLPVTADRSGARWRSATQIVRWMAIGFPSPAPESVKFAVLMRWGYPRAPWIETGTFRGDMTARLAPVSDRVVTIEPMDDLHRAAVERFVESPHVEVLHGTSEDRLGSAIDGLPVGPLNFWLDGHFSGGVTFRGDADTPILQELSEVERVIAAGRAVSVLVDDVRLFAARHVEAGADGDRSGYPRSAR